MNTQTISDTMTKPLKKAIEVKKTIQTPALIPSEDFEEIIQIIERKSYDKNLKTYEDHERMTVDFGNGYNTEFIWNYRSSKLDPETNETIEWDKDDKEVEGGNIFKGNEITGDSVSVADFGW